MSKMLCSNCGTEGRVVRGNHRFDEAGVPVMLQGIKLVRCPKCRNEDPIIPNVNDLMKVLALAVACKPYRLRGEDVRFLRKYLSMNGDGFARLIHVDRTTLSKWETNDDPVGEQSDRLIRLIALSLGEGLREKLVEAIRSFPSIRKQPRKVRINMDPAKMSYAYA